ncbi:MAG: hypothetical protein IPQ07_02830 [Myxococcales bacterium]|nr:hypothetical protein [Myxococcales bacterium]
MSRPTIHLAIHLAIAASLSSIAHADAPSAIPSERLPSEAPLPSPIKPKGKRLIAAWKFSGADKVPGYLVLSSTTGSTKAGESRQLFAQLYAGAKSAQVRLVQDGVTNCQLDMTSSFVQGAVSFGDVDGDGKVEVAFAYDLGCDATERPTPRKLLVLEGAAKHALRGNGRGKDLDDKPTGGDYKAEGFKGEDAIAKWAKARWTELLATPAINVDP